MKPTKIMHENRNNIHKAEHQFFLINLQNLL